jgi:LysM repeat protein
MPLPARQPAAPAEAIRCDIKGLPAESAMQHEQNPTHRTSLLRVLHTSPPGPDCGTAHPETDLMTSPQPRPAGLERRAQRRHVWGCLPVAVVLLCAGLPAQAADAVSPAQRATATQVAQTGLPLSALAADAPASHTVQRGDTLWDIAKLFLKSPWRWPELWGMNLAEVANPHLIYPGQVLVLVKTGDTVQLRLGQAPTGAGGAGTMPLNTVKLSPRVRSQVLDNGAIASIPLQLITPFLNEALVLDDNALASAPRIVATQEGRVMISRGETAYVRGDLQGGSQFALVREAKPLRDPASGQVLGYEAGFVGTATLVQPESTSVTNGLPVPATFVMTSARQEAGVGDRLAPLPPHDYSAYMPHPPTAALSGQVVSVYGEALNGGQNQIVALNRGAREGVERGHVLALWRAGSAATDETGRRAQPVQLPDERSGLLFVFRVFDRVSYALILSAVDPVRAGDRITQP